MKIIHCADLHLDSKMERNLDKENAKERKRELLATFERLVRYAADNNVEAVLIAGDMFDTSKISATTRNVVLSNITENPDINFYYLKGNHDNDNFLSGLSKVPDNLKMFDSNWSTYEEEGGKITISAVELTKDKSGAIYNQLVLDSGKFNIVMLHGQESESTQKDKTEVINLKALRNKGIDYLALGHVHFHKMEKLDPRATYCYPGCLEGRGFDECGEHGFVLLDIDIDAGKCTPTFIPFAKRRLYEIKVDVSDCDNTSEMLSRARNELDEVSPAATSLIKIVLDGMVDVECTKDENYICTALKDDYYYLKVKDETRLKIDIESYMSDVSLKGEFVRNVMSDSLLSEEDKKIIIRYGLLVLAGEEVV